MSCLATALVAVAACGPGGGGPGSGGQTTTPRALAAVLVDQVGEPTYAEASEGVDHYGEDAVGATIRIDVQDVPEDQRQLVVGDDLPDELTSCDAEPVTRDQCAEIGDAVLTWAEEEPTAAAIAAGDDLTTWRGPDENPVYEQG